MKKNIYKIIIAAMVIGTLSYSTNNLSAVTIKNDNSGARVENKVSITARTGGNIIRPNGSSTVQNIKTGDYSIDVKVKNTVDGESLEPVEIKMDSDSGTLRDLSEVKESGKSRTEIKIDVDDNLQSVSSTTHEKIDNIRSEIKAKRDQRQKEREARQAEKENATTTVIVSSLSNDININAANQPEAVTPEISNTDEGANKFLSAIINFFKKVFSFFV